MATTVLDPKITKVAEQYFDENRAMFIQSLAERVQLGIERAQQDKKHGRHMDLATFEKRLYELDLSI